MDHALDLRDVTVAYPDGLATVTALDDASMTLEAGTFAALVGPSGSGKSTLLAVAAGLTVPTSGRVLVGGADVTAMSPRERTRLRSTDVGLIFQQPNLLPSLTALEQLQLAAHVGGEAPRRSAARARDLLARVDLTDAADKRPHQLSGGMRQRVNIARALMGAPRVLLVDEPTSALDQERSAHVVELLGEITREFDVATLMVTHDTEFLASVDEVWHMRDGRLTAPSAARAAA